MTEECNVVTDTLRVVKAVKRHLEEELCTHSIDFIVKEALELKNAVAHNDGSTD
jgi:hypothetical protein